MAAGLLVFVGSFQGQAGDIPPVSVNPELALPDVHSSHGVEALRRMVLDNGLQRLVWEVLHTEETNCESNLIRDVPHVNRIELSLPDCLHLAADTGYTYLIETERPSCFLEPGDLGADAVLRPSCLENVLAAHSNERFGLPWSVSFACHNSSIDYPLDDLEKRIEFENESEETGIPVYEYEKDGMPTPLTTTF